MKAYERFLKYAAVWTPSRENSGTHPSSSCQFDLARELVTELQALGLSDAAVDEHCYVYAHLPASPGYENCTSIGFISHMDTVSDFCEHPTIPCVTPDYDGAVLPLGNSGRTLDPAMFPHLLELRGETLITGDGTTVLGADDKAGIAEIMTLLEHLQKERIPHGPVSVAFTPDEEIGSGADLFDVPRFSADFAYTLDGETEGEIQYENFNACKAVFRIQGVNVHPGSSKNTMVNASLVAMEINAMLPACEVPRYTEDYEGFYHLLHMDGEVGAAALSYIVRDHDASSFQARQALLQHIEKTMNEKWGAGTVSLTITQQYKNMAEIIKTCPQLIEHAKTACKNVGVPPLILPIRGGTDGARLSFMGLPCPNLGTGGHGFHGPYEHITAESMDRVVRIACELTKLFAEEGSH